MSNTIIKNQEQLFIEIPLYESKVIRPNFWGVFGKIITAIIFVIACIYYGLAIEEGLLIISATTMTMLVILSYEYRDYLFPVSNHTLVIAYKELYFIDDNEVEWSMPLQHVQIKVFQNDVVNDFFKININVSNVLIIKYINSSFWDNLPFDEVFSDENCTTVYHIYTLSDWEILIQTLYQKKLDKTLKTAI